MSLLTKWGVRLNLLQVPLWFRRKKMRPIQPTFQLDCCQLICTVCYIVIDSGLNIQGNTWMHSYVVDRVFIEQARDVTRKKTTQKSLCQSKYWCFSLLKIISHTHTHILNIVLHSSVQVKGQELVECFRLVSCQTSWDLQGGIHKQKTISYFSVISHQLGINILRVRTSFKLKSYQAPYSKTDMGEFKGPLMNQSSSGWIKIREDGGPTVNHSSPPFSIREAFFLW